MVMNDAPFIKVLTVGRNCSRFLTDVSNIIICVSRLKNLVVKFRISSSTLSIRKNVYMHFESTQIIVLNNIQIIQVKYVEKHELKNLNDEWF